MSRLRFRPELHALEAREVPALNLFYNGADLLLTGTPTAGVTEFVIVRNAGGDNFQVTDGALNLGTYHVTRDLTLRLTRFDTNVSVDLAGGRLGRNLSIDIGAGDTDPATRTTVSLVTNAENARVGGDVTFRGGSGQERFVVLTVDEDETPLDIGGSVRVLGNRVTTPIEDSFTLGAGVTVHGDVTTSRITYTTISGTVNGDVTANALDSPGGMGFRVSGTVHGDVTATGGATADGYYSYAAVSSGPGSSGRVDGDVNFRFTSGRGAGLINGTVGGDVRLTYPALPAGSRDHTADFFGRVGGNAVVQAAGPLTSDLAAVFDRDVTVTGTGRFAEVLMEAEIAGDFRFAAGPATYASIQLAGAVKGNATVDLGGSAGTTAWFEMFDLFGGAGELLGRVGGDLTVRSRAGATRVKVGNDAGGAHVGGDLRLDLGDGANTFAFNGAQGATLGGKLTYTGGRGTDSVTVSGRNTFAATIKTGAGNDTVAFAPDATVGSLAIDFGAGTDTWTPPGVIAFPVKLKRLP